MAEGLGKGDFPFLCVHKPSGLGNTWDYSIPLTARSDKFTPLPATVTEDGKAQVAMSVVYGDKREAYGPLYESSVIDGGKIKIHFTHGGGGRAFKDGDKLQGLRHRGSG